MFQQIHNMKKIILFLCLLFVFGLSKAQVYQLMPQYGYDVKRMKFDSTLSIPTTCGVPTIKSNVIKNGAIAFDSCNKRFYAYDPKDQTWAQVSGGSSIDSTIVQTKYRSDTARVNIYSALDAKLNKSDSTLYQTKYRTDTARTNIYTSLNTKLNKADTIFMEQRKVPYTGATTDVDLGANGLNAKNIKVTGTTGAGHVDLKHQSANSSAQGNSSVIFANASGNLSYDNDNNGMFILKNNHFTADHEFRLPDSTGTFALLQNVNNRFVDSIYRKSGKDSIFYRIGLTESRIVGFTGGKEDAPDRITGIADNNVIADMKDLNITFKRVDTFSIISSVYDTTRMLFLDGTNYLLDLGDFNKANMAAFRIANTGSAASAELKITNPILITSIINDGEYQNRVQSNYSYNVSLNAADYIAEWVGVYVVSESDATSFFRLPSASKFQGLQVTIINDSGADVLMADNGGTALTKGAATLLDQEVGIYVSDGSYWHGYKSVDR